MNEKDTPSLMDDPCGKPYVYIGNIPNATVDLPPPEELEKIDNTVKTLLLNYKDKSSWRSLETQILPTQEDYSKLDSLYRESLEEDKTRHIDDTINYILKLLDCNDLQFKVDFLKKVVNKLG